MCFRVLRLGEEEQQPPEETDSYMVDAMHPHKKLQLGHYITRKHTKLALIVELGSGILGFTPFWCKGVGSNPAKGKLNN